MLIAGSDTYFLEVTARVSLKAATINAFRVKKTHENLDFYRAKSEEYNQKDRSLCDKFGMPWLGQMHIS